MCVFFLKVFSMNRIKSLRNENNMSQLQLADLLAVGRTTVSNYELEINQLDPPTIRKLCEIFQVSSDYLLGISSQRTAQITDEEAALVEAYHAAPESVRTGIDALLAPYKREEKETAVG